MKINNKCTISYTFCECYITLIKLLKYTISKKLNVLTKINKTYVDYDLGTLLVLLYSKSLTKRVWTIFHLKINKAIYYPSHNKNNSHCTSTIATMRFCLDIYLHKRREESIT